MLSFRRTATLIPVITLALTGLAVVAAPAAQAAPPGNDNLAAATTLVPGTKASATTVDSTLESSESSGDSQPSCGNISNSVWFKWTAPALSAGNAAVETSGTTPVDTVVQVWSGASAMFPLTAVACDDQSGAGDFSLAKFAVSPGTTYYIQVGNYVEEGFITPPGPFDITLSAPENDNLAKATTITNAPSTTLSVSNVTATVEPGETGQPTPSSCANFKNSIWFKVTPTSSGPLTATTIQTTSPSADTQVQVYSGPAAAPTFPLTPLGCNDDIDLPGGNFFSKISVAATAGTTYYLQVTSYGVGSTTGAFDLKVEVPQPVPPANDDLGAAATLVLPSTPSVNNLVATKQSGEPVPTLGDCEQIEKTAWYAYTPATTQGVTFDTLGTATGDTVVAVYSGPPGQTTFTPPLTPVACNDDVAPGSFRSKVSFLAASGTTYYIQVGSYSTSGGGQLSLNFQPYAATTTTLQGSATGRTETFTATVTGPTGTTPVGKVQLFQDVALIDEANLSGGTATFTLNDVPLGQRTYHAVYVPTPDSGYDGSTSGDVDVTVSEQTALTLDGSASGTTVTLDAVQATAAGSQFAQGSMEFFEGPTSKGVVGLSGVGTAQLVINGVPAGVHTYHAVFTPQPGSGYEAATSADKSVTVSAPPPPAKVKSATTVKAPKQVKSGKAPKITITVKRGSAPASGQVTVTIKKLGFTATVTLAANGTVKVKLPKLVKKAKVAVAYAGNSTTLASSAKATIKIKKK